MNKQDNCPKCHLEARKCGALRVCTHCKLEWRVPVNPWLVNNRVDNEPDTKEEYYGER